MDSERKRLVILLFWNVFQLFKANFGPQCPGNLFFHPVQQNKNSLIKKQTSNRPTFSSNKTQSSSPKGAAKVGFGTCFSILQGTNSSMITSAFWVKWKWF